MSMKKLLNLIARLFIGSRIGQKLPLLHAVYKKLISSSDISMFTIPMGLNLKAPNDCGPALYLSSKGKYEPFETSLFISSVCKSDVVFDIGAHVGYYSLISSKLAKKVFAFEPEKKNLKLLRKNLRLNRVDNCQVVETAVSDKNGKIKLYLSQTSSGDHSISQKKNSFELVDSLALDNFASKIKSLPNLLKIDVEGAELTVLQGAKRLLSRKELREILVKVTKNTNSNKVIKLLHDRGFTLFLIDKHRKELYPFSRREFRRLLDKYGFINILAKR